MSLFNLGDGFKKPSQTPIVAEPQAPRIGSKRENFATVARALAASQQRIDSLHAEVRKLTIENAKLNERIKYELNPMSEFFSRHWASPDEAMAWERMEELRKQREDAIMSGEGQFTTIPYEKKDAEEGESTL